MTEAEVANRLASIKCFVLGVDGTICLGNTLFPASRKLLQRLESTGRDYLLVPNNSALAPAGVADKLNRPGLRIPPEKIYSAADATLEFLLNLGPGHRLCIFGTPALIRFFEANGFIIDHQSPDALLVGTDLAFDYGRLELGIRLLRTGIPFFATHPDMTFLGEKGAVCPDCGAITAALTAASGIEPTILGKPSASMIEGILRRTGVGREEIALIGDRLETDILAGVNHGILTILVLTGETSMERLKRATIKPDFFVPSLQHLLKYLNVREEDDAFADDFPPP